MALGSLRSQNCLSISVIGIPHDHNSTICVWLSVRLISCSFRDDLTTFDSCLIVRYLNIILVNRPQLEDDTIEQHTSSIALVPAGTGAGRLFIRNASLSLFLNPIACDCPRFQGIVVDCEHVWLLAKMNWK